MKEYTRNSHSEGSKNPGRIKVCQDGPYIVSGQLPMNKQVIIPDENGNSLRWAEGHQFPAPEEYALCRCGQSDNKPYCDETHLKVNFQGVETASRDSYLVRARRLRGPQLDLTDDESLCASGRFCDRDGGAWRLTQASDNPKARDIAIQEACDCPSGRLVAWDKKAGPAIEPDCEPSIGIIEDPGANVSGPIWIRGAVPIEAVDGTPYEVRNRVTLCRCGSSQNKPFCDATHVEIGFSDTK